MPLGVALVVGIVDVDDPDSVPDDVQPAATTATTTTAIDRTNVRRRHVMLHLSMR